MLGYLLVIISTLSFSAVNITDKIVSGTEDRYVSLLIRYVIALIIGALLILIFNQGFIFPDWRYSITLIFAGAIYYTTNLIMYAGLKHINVGAFFSIGYLYLVWLFFINIWLFGQSEILSPLKTFFGFSFLGITIYMIYDAGRGKRGDFIGYLLAFVCAIGWTLGFGTEGFVIKHHIISPIMTAFLSYGGAVIAAIFGFFLTRKHHGYTFLENKKMLLAPFLGGVLLSIGTASFLTAYTYLPNNIVNTISISDILVTTLLSIIFLNEKPHRKQSIFIITSFLILGGFVFVK